MTPPRGESRHLRRRHFGGHRRAVTPLALARTADYAFVCRVFDLYDGEDLGAVRQTGLRLVLSQSSRAVNHDDLSPRMFPGGRVHPVAWVREFPLIDLRCDCANSSNRTRPANAAAPQRMSPPRGLLTTGRFPSQPTKAPEHLPVESSCQHEPRIPDCVFSPSREALP